MSFDLDDALRWSKAQKKSPPRPRGLERLRSIDDEPVTGGLLLLDTCVYIDGLQATAPDAMKTLLEARICCHSAVCLAELTHLFGRLSPDHPGTAAVLGELRAVVTNLPPHRLVAPSASLWGRAGILAGMAERSREGGSAGQKSSLRVLNDALIYCQAVQLGASVLTANADDFAAFDRLAGTRQIIVYRRAEKAA